MKGRAFVARLRSTAYFNPELDEQRLLADAVEEADESFRALIESECLTVTPPGETWWDTLNILDGVGGSFPVHPLSGERYSINKALSYLDRRGLIVRKEGEPHLVRFTE